MVSNVFESGSRRVIPAVLIYLRRGTDVLMLHRVAPDRPDDYHAGKWNGLGGKLEADESPLEAGVRELAEEAGVRLKESELRVLGVLQFPNFKAHKNEDWVVWVLTGALPPGQEPWAKGPEGNLKWINASALAELNLWAGDRTFIPFVAENKPFHGTIWYRGQDVLRASVHAFSHASHSASAED